MVVSNDLFQWVEMDKDVFLVSRVFGYVIWIKGGGLEMLFG